VGEHKTTENGGHEGVSSAFEKFVDPELEAAMKGEARAENFVLAEDQEKYADADAQQGECVGIARAMI
jgi:hypothetical protein